MPLLLRTLMHSTLGTLLNTLSLFRHLDHLLPQMDGASAAVLSVLPKAAAAIISAATNAEGQLSAAQPQVKPSHLPPVLDVQ